MGIFSANIETSKLNRLEELIESRISERMKKHGGYIADERNLVSGLTDYSGKEMEEVSYELFRAREYVRIFSEEDFFTTKRFSRVRTFYRRVVRRLLRQQIVFNEFILGALEDINERLSRIERKIDSLDGEKQKSDKGGSRD